jgi:uncharacterized protein YdaU (DUF1376 family)
MEECEMGKDPAFLFYPGDYVGGTMGMSFEEKGAYMDLLMMQFNRGHMTEHMIRHVVGHLWDTIQHKFKQDAEGLWYNERLDIEKERRKSYTDSRKNNKEGKNQYNKNDGHMTKHMTGHMENRDKNVNNKFKIPSINEVKQFFIENGYTELSGEKAWNYYNDGNWHDSSGKPVKSWKQKMRVVWFKDENKLPKRTLA